MGLIGTSMTRSRPKPSGVRRAASLRWLPWVILVAGAAVGRLAADPETGRVDPAVVTAFTGLLFGVVSLRVVLALIARPARRPALLALLAGLILWVVGSLALSSYGDASPLKFPSPGEWVFLAGYVCLAAFVFLDGQPATARLSAAAWADAAILCGGAAAAASMVLLTPLSLAYPDAGTGLLVALLFPLLNLLLALLVIGQWALGAREGGTGTASMAGGFVALALADTSLLLGMPSGTYSFALVADVLWGVGFVLLVDGACARRTRGTMQAPRRVPVALLLAGVAVAILLLAIRPAGVVGLLVAASAGVVLAASGVRLVLALQAAQSASDALRRSAVDDLTGLPNRRALVARLEDAVRSGERVGLLIADVDGFQELNDALGHEAGDFLLRVVGGRLGELLPAGAMLARLGGDDFAMVVASDDQVVLFELAAAARGDVAQPVGVDGLAVSVRISLGLTWRMDSDVVAADLLRRGEAALHAAKLAGSGVEVYQEDTDVFSRQRLELAHDLRTAIRSRQLTVWYQPSVTAHSGEVESLEALVRWDHPREGVVPMALLAPLARREGLMLELARQAAAHAIDDLAEWRAAGLDVCLALHVAPEELREGALVTYLLECLAQARVEPRFVTVVVAEDSFRVRPEQARNALDEARMAGLRTAIGDYGSGFSSLSHLRDLPVAEVRLDRTFFAAVCNDPRSAVIVSSTVAMAHALGMRVVAEGVETQIVAARAIVLGVDALQGFYLSHPLEGADVPAYVRQVAITAPIG